VRLSARSGQMLGSLSSPIFRGSVYDENASRALTPQPTIPKDSLVGSCSHSQTRDATQVFPRPLSGLRRTPYLTREVNEMLASPIVMATALPWPGLFPLARTVIAQQ
jgi:hypothetical protein